MAHLPLLIALVALLVVTASWLTYLASIPKEKVPKKPTGALMLMAAGSAAAIAAPLASISSGTSPIASAAIGVTTVGLAFFFVYLLRLAPLPDGQLVVKVGDPLPAFSALDEHGAEVRSNRWKNKRLLFKFFRGHW